jgi:hypothetical protein
MSALNLGTAHLSDQALVEEFESCRLPTAQFHHADHIRLAWNYLGQMTEAEATRRIEQSIRRYAAHNKIPHLYHHTITLAWMKLAAAAFRATPPETGFPEFAARNPELFDVQRLKNYFSKELLESAQARADWVEPDLRRLP